MLIIMHLKKITTAKHERKRTVKITPAMRLAAPMNTNISSRPGTQNMVHRLTPDASPGSPRTGTKFSDQSPMTRKRLGTDKR